MVVKEAEERGSRPPRPGGGQEEVQAAPEVRLQVVVGSRPIAVARVLLELVQADFRRLTRSLRPKRKSEPQQA